MNITAKMYVRLWNGEAGKVLSVVGSKAEVLMANGVRKCVEASQVVEAESNEKFELAQKRLQSFKVKQSAAAAAAADEWNLDKREAAVVDNRFGMRRSSTESFDATFAGLTAVAVKNEDVINMFVQDSFPKDKMPQWGTDNLKITKEIGGWALYNYSTPILFRNNKTGELFFNTNKYSVTTSKVQGRISMALTSAGVSVTEVDEAGIDKARDDAYDAAEAKKAEGSVEKTAGQEKRMTVIRVNDKKHSAWDDAKEADAKAKELKEGTKDAIRVSSERVSGNVPNGYHFTGKEASVEKKAIGTEGPYKSDEDIAAEFKGMSVQQFEITDRKDPISGVVRPDEKNIMISLSFPEGGESVGGGADFTVEHFVAKKDEDGDWSYRGAVDNWYPEEMYNKIIAEVEDRFEKEIGSPLDRVISAKTAGGYNPWVKELGGPNAIPFSNLAVGEVFSFPNSTVEYKKVSKTGYKPAQGDVKGTASCRAGTAVIPKVLKTPADANMAPVVAGHPQDLVDAEAKYHIGDILIPAENYDEGDIGQAMHILDIKTEEKVYVVDKRPRLEEAEREKSETFGVRFEIPIATLDKEKSWVKFADKKEIDAIKSPVRTQKDYGETPFKASELAKGSLTVISVKEVEGNICLEFSDSPHNGWIAFDKEGNFQRSFRMDDCPKAVLSEFGNMVKTFGAEKIASMVAIKRLNQKKEALRKQVPHGLKAGDKVKLAEDVLQQHSRSVPPHMGYTTEQFSWRDTLDKHLGQVGTIERTFGDSGEVNVEFGEGTVIGIDGSQVVKQASADVERLQQKKSALEKLAMNAGDRYYVLNDVEFKTVAGDSITARPGNMMIITNAAEGTVEFKTNPSVSWENVKMPIADFNKHVMSGDFEFRDKFDPDVQFSRAMKRLQQKAAALDKKSDKDLTSYKGFSIGDRVTVKIAEPAYDDVGMIEPGMVGTIKAFPPKVRITPVSETTDGLPYFAYIVFDKVYDEVHQNKMRGGVDIKNLVKATEASIKTADVEEDRLNEMYEKELADLQKGLPSWFHLDIGEDPNTNYPAVEYRVDADAFIDPTWSAEEKEAFQADAEDAAENFVATLYGPDSGSVSETIKQFREEGETELADRLDPQSDSYDEYYAEKWWALDAIHGVTSGMSWGEWVDSIKYYLEPALLQMRVSKERIEALINELAGEENPEPSPDKGDKKKEKEEADKTLRKKERDDAWKAAVEQDDDSIILRDEKRGLTSAISRLKKKAARLGQWDFDKHEPIWKLEAGEDGKKKLVRTQK